MDKPEKDSNLPPGHEGLVWSLCRSFAQTFGRFDNEHSLTETVKAFDALNVLDWHKPLNQKGQALLTVLAVEGILPRDLLEEVVKRHGTAVLTQIDQDGQPAFVAVWEEMVKAYAKDKNASDYRSAYARHPFEDDLAIWIRLLPSESLRRFDEEGTCMASGWLARALTRQMNTVTGALLARGAVLTASHKVTPLVLGLNTGEQWQAFLKAGGDPLQTGFSKEFPDMPLWEYLLFRRGPVRPDLAEGIRAHAATANYQGQAEVDYWYQLLTMKAESEVFYAHVCSVEDWPTRRDRYGRSPLVLAALRNPQLWREVAVNRRDKHNILKQRDKDGHGVWFYIWPNIDDRTMTNKLWAGLSERAPWHQTVLDAGGNGLMAQVFRNPGRTRELLRTNDWCPNVSAGSDSAKWVARMSDEQIWGMSEQAEKEVAAVLRGGWSPEQTGFFRVMNVVAADVGERGQSPRQHPFYQATERWSPELRGEVLRSALSWMVSLKGQWGRGGSDSSCANVKKMLAHWDAMGWRLARDDEAEARWKREMALKLDEKTNSGGSSGETERFVRDWMNKIDLWHKSHQLERVVLDVAPDTAVAPRRRMRM